ncbi:MAG TPA: hypothetical protein VNG33_18990 [Polyangiaceae bacterium]|nr:hypothetical protein [Polyangiaceae bacterium]
MAYSSTLYAPHPFYGGYRGGPYGQSILSLFRPAFNNPGGYLGQQQQSSQPLINALVKPAAPLFSPAPLGGKGIIGAPSLGGGGTLQSAGGTSSGATTFGGDPVLNKAQAIADMMNKQAQAAAVAAEKTNLIRFGDPDLVLRVLGGGHTETYNKGPMAGQDKKTYKYADVQKAAAGNPFSTTQELGRWNDRSNTGINEQRNQQGLFYSSARARDLALQGEDFLRNKSKAANDLQDAISAIQAQLLNAQMQANQYLQSARESAAARAAANATSGA